MLITKQNWPRWLLGGIALCAFLFLAEWGQSISSLIPSEPEIICKHERETGQKYCHTSELVAPFLDWLLDQHTIVTALATAVIALFTFILSRSSERMWHVSKESADAAKKSADAAQTSADALIGAERPILVVDMLRVTGLNGPPNEAGEIPLRCLYEYANAGKTAAWLRINCLKNIINPTLPDSPEYGETTIIRYVVPSGGGYGNTMTGIPSKPFKSVYPAVIDAIRNGQTNCFFYGFMEYEDAFEWVHRSGFAYQMVFDGGVDHSVHFRPTGSPAYWYETKRKAAE